MVRQGEERAGHGVGVRAELPGVADALHHQVLARLPLHLAHAHAGEETTQGTNMNPNF